MYGVDTYVGACDESTVLQGEYYCFIAIVSYGVNVGYNGFARTLVGIFYSFLDGWCCVARPCNL